MLPKSHRLPSLDIRQVMQTGRRVNAKGVQLIVAPNTLPVSRFAFVVPISVDKRAVVRNRVRRLVRESVRLVLPKLAPGRDGIFFVRKSWTDELAGVEAAVQDLLRQAALL